MKPQFKHQEYQTEAASAVVRCFEGPRQGGRKEIEQKKINYARKPFEALGHADIKYDVIDSDQALRDKIMS